jgi:ribonuclease HII
MNNDLILGIDEAGMGPVFGPLIISGVVIKKQHSDLLRTLGVKDSKLFGSGLKAHEKREQVWASVKPYLIKQKQVVIEPSALDRANMYDLHLGAVQQILKELGWQYIETVYIEQVGGLGAEKCFSKIGYWHEGFMYETKADVRFPVVSLASIKAKILRDRLMIKLCKDLDEEYVSGYPNKNTEEFFRRYHEKHGSLPPGTRLSRNWAPINEMK